jgi:hypothetical protein
MQTLKTRLAVGAGAVIALGLTAISVGPARASLEAVMSCAQSSACLEWDNTKSGDAVKGVSLKGNAIHGQTKFARAGKSAGKAGVLGEDLSASGTLNAGVSGVSTNGAGVLGTSSTFNGVEGLSTSSSGVYGQTSGAAGFGVAGRDVSTTHDNNGAGVLADGGLSDDGIHAFSTGHNAMYAFTQSGDALVAHSETGTTLDLSQGGSSTATELLLEGNSAPNHTLILAQDASGQPIFNVLNNHSIVGNGPLLVSTSSGVAATFLNSTGNPNVTLQVYASTRETNGTVFVVSNSDGTGQMSVTDTGNVTIKGLIFTQGGCNTGCLVNNRQVRGIGEYAPVETEPTIEDNGEAMLVNGRADVTLDTQFVNAIDASSQYLVSVTPEGDCHGLYVSNRTPRGFTVRELEGGRADVAFEYRIVAKRYGVNAPRLPMTAVRRYDRPRLPSRG